MSYPSVYLTVDAGGTDRPAIWDTCMFAFLRGQLHDVGFSIFDINGKSCAEIAPLVDATLVKLRAMGYVPTEFLPDRAELDVRAFHSFCEFADRVRRYPLARVELGNS